MQFEHVVVLTLHRPEACFITDLVIFITDLVVFRGGMIWDSSVYAVNVFYCHWLIKKLL